MASGSIELVRNPGGVYLIGRILWSSQSNGTEANTSTVTATLQLQRDAANTTTGTFKGTFTVDSTSQTISWYGALPSRTWVTIHTITATVNHNPEGAGNCYLYAKINGPGLTTMEGTYVSGTSTATLDTIPRYAALTAAPDFHDEEDPVIAYSNPAGNSVSTLDACISLDGSNDDISYRSIPKTGSGYTFTLTEAERNLLRSAVTAGRSREIFFYVRTVIGGSIGYSTVSRILTIKDPEPVIQPTVTDSNDTTYALTGSRDVLIRYYSDAAVTIGASAVKQAVLAGQKVACGGKSLTGDGTIHAVESGSFVFSATDSRGITAQKTVTVPFVEYIRLTCSLENNIPDTAGNLTVKAVGNWFSGSFGIKNNTLKVFYRYKTYGGTYCAWQEMTLSKNGNTYTAEAKVTGLDYRTAYVVQTYAVDALSTAYSAERIVKATPVFDWGKDAFCFHVPVVLDGEADILRQGVSAFAPAGYGLGEVYCKRVNAVEEITQNGYYALWLDPANGDPTVGNYVFHAVVDGNYSNVHLEGKIAGGYIHRDKWDGVWDPWEWVNPPMMTGVEYRMTKRWNGKPVYTQLIYGGGLPGSGSMHIDIPTSGTLDTVLWARGSLTDQRVFPSGVIGGVMSVDLETHGGGIEVSVSHDFLAGSAVHILVEYTLL